MSMDGQTDKPKAICHINFFKVGGINMHTQLASGTRGLKFGLSFIQLPYTMFVRSEGSGETTWNAYSSGSSLLADAIVPKS